MNQNPKDISGIAAVLAASTIWGASFVLAKHVMNELPVVHITLYRFLFAGAPLIPILIRSQERIARQDLPLFVLTGFLMVPVTILLQFAGLALTSATSTALMVGVGTPLLAVAGVLFEKEVLGSRGWSAVALSSLGVVLLVGAPGDGNDWIGNLLVLASIFVSVVWILTSKRLIQRYSAFFATSWFIVIGTVFLIPITLLWSGPPAVSLSFSAWANLIGLGVGCTTFAYAAWNWGVSRIGAAPAGIYLNLEPMTGAFLGIVLLGDSLTGGILAGGALILVAAMMISTTPRPKPRRDREKRPPSPGPHLAPDCGSSRIT